MDVDGFRLFEPYIITLEVQLVILSVALEQNCCILGRFKDIKKLTKVAFKTCAIYENVLKMDSEKLDDVEKTITEQAPTF